MLNITITIEGLEQIKKGLAAAPLLTVNEMSKAVEKSLNEIRNQALKEAPVGQQGGGNLRQNIRPVRMITKLLGEVLSAAGYSVYVHEGTRPHIIRVVNKKVLANKRTGEFFGEVVNHPGTKPNPFITRAMEKSKAKVEQYFKEAMINILKNI